jgi:hypothetical protein
MTACVHGKIFHHFSNVCRNFSPITRVLGRLQAPFFKLKTNHLLRCKFLDQSHSFEEGVDPLLFFRKKLAEFSVENVFLLVLFRSPAQKWKNILYCLHKIKLCLLLLYFKTTKSWTGLLLIRIDRFRPT